MAAPTLILPERSHAIATDLRALLGPEKVKDDVPALTAYAVDASIYRMTPKAIVLVESEEDIARTIEYAVARGIPLTPRAAGTNLTGSAIGSGIILDVALDPAAGKEIWRSNVAGPVRGAPTVFADRVMVVSIDNQTTALSAVDGKELWTHTGLSETAGLLGGTSPAAAADIVVSPYSSGELVALRLETGRPQWSENLITARRSDSVSNLADISGRPVIDRGRVFAIGNAGIVAAIDQRSGSRIWDKQIGGTQTPWVAGDWVFVLSNNSEVVALSREPMPVPRAL